jgi:Ca2+-transporting ATPase
MATFHQVDGRLVAFAKGAPAAIAAICRPEMHDRILEINQRLAGEGLRVIAVATGDVSAPTADALTSLTPLGLIGLADPPAPGVKETIEALRAAGLRTVMLTGDQRLTAEAVGRQLRVIDEGDTAIDGQALDGMSPSDVTDAVTRHAVFSRITPEHKLIIVRALQAKGEIVAMLGDGVNDAAALKQANVGVAMGKRGTDVAKQAAAVVLQDDRFETIAVAVEQGRVIFDNIRKFVFYLFSCNIAEILMLLIAGVAGLPLPLLPLQLLWLNMLTDTFPALALALEPGDAGIMQRPPRRPYDAFLSRAFMGGILLYGGLITLATIGAYLWALDSRPERATTIAFMTLAFAQVLHLGNARRHGPVLSVTQMFSNPYAIAGAGVAAGLQLAAYVIAPLAAVLHVTALDRQEWLVTIGCALVPAVIGQTIKLVRSWRHKSHLTV